MSDAEDAANFCFCPGAEAARRAIKDNLNIYRGQQDWKPNYWNIDSLTSLQEAARLFLHPQVHYVPRPILSRLPATDDTTAQRESAVHSKGLLDRLREIQAAEGRAAQQPSSPVPNSPIGQREGYPTIYRWEDAPSKEGGITIYFDVVRGYQISNYRKCKNCTASPTTNCVCFPLGKNPLFWIAPR